MACSQELGGENYAKLCQIQAVVVEVLKALLVKETSTNGNTIDQLMFAQKRKILSSDIGRRFSSVLFPQGNQATDLDDWDLTLFCFILRSVCTLPPTQDCDVNDVRLTRNAIHHLPKPIISDRDYLKFANVFKTFIANALNYLNDQHLKAEINQQVDEAERPVSKQVIKAFDVAHKLYLKDKSIFEDLKEHTNGNTNEIREDLKDLKAVLSTLPKEFMSLLNPPGEVSFKLLLRNCSPKAESEISEELVRLFEEEIGRTEGLSFSDDVSTQLNDAVRTILKRLQNKGADPTHATNGCVCIFVRFNDFTSYMDFLEDTVDGKLIEIATQLQTSLRRCYENDDLKVEIAMNSEQMSFCFEDTLECLKNVCAKINSAEKHSKKVGLNMDLSGPSKFTESDMIMSTFESELHKMSDLYLSSGEEEKCQQALKSAIAKLAISDICIDERTEQLKPANRDVLSLLKSLQVDEIIKQTEYDCEDIFVFDQIDEDKYQYRYEPELINKVVTAIVKLRDDALLMQESVIAEKNKRFGSYGTRNSSLSLTGDARRLPVLPVVLVVTFVITFLAITVPVFTQSKTPGKMEAADTIKKSLLLIGLMIVVMIAKKILAITTSFLGLVGFRDFFMKRSVSGFEHREMKAKAEIGSYGTRNSSLSLTGDARRLPVLPVVLVVTFVITFLAITVPVFTQSKTPGKMEAADTIKKSLLLIGLMIVFMIGLMIGAMIGKKILAITTSFLGLVSFRDFFMKRSVSGFEHREMKAKAEIGQMKDPYSFYQIMDSEFSTFVSYVDKLYDTLQDVKNSIGMPMSYFNCIYTEKKAKRRLEDVTMSWEALKELATSPSGKTHYLR
ncbi:hypothetical protein MAR_036237 [Mya arenaria]|uniref:Uncharacterized protein n=1 Tax=Mya arenaria TaxID=6604 RepID=A0ABY7EQR5_MYAAR|nr:hypothetical protein MAR_036237 [Mya arenaria]